MSSLTSLRRREADVSRFFINRPIVAIVISILTVIVGAITIVSLPVSQFPAIAPPEVQVQTTYVGADAQTVEQSVATPIEQQMSGVDNMNYMYSVNSSTGEMRLIVDFDVQTDPNTDLILTQLRQAQAASQLPAEVTNFGVTVQKSLTAPLMLISLYSPSGAYDSKFLANYAYINLNDQLTRVPGIGSVQVFGAGRYAMRLWVKPDQLAKLGITVPEIVTAIQSQNTVNPAGQIGGEPAPKGQEFTYSVRAQGRLTFPEEFEQIVVRAAPDGGIVRVKDVARVELGAQDYTIIGHLNGKPSAIVAVYQLPGSNAVQAAAGVKSLLAEQRQRLPRGVDYTDCAGYHARRHGRHQRDRRDPADRHRAGDRRGLRLPARLARDPDSAAGRAGLAGRDVRRFSRCSDSPSTRCRCSAWCWRSASSWTTPSSWWRRSSTTSKKGCRRRMRPSRRWRRSRHRSSASPWCCPPCSSRPHSSPGSPAASISNSR